MAIDVKFADSFGINLYEKIAPLKLSDDVAKKVIDIVFWAIEKERQNVPLKSSSALVE